MAADQRIIPCVTTEDARSAPAIQRVIATEPARGLRGTIAAHPIREVAALGSEEPHQCVSSNEYQDPTARVGELLGETKGQVHPHPGRLRPLRVVDASVARDGTIEGVTTNKEIVTEEVVVTRTSSQSSVAGEAGWGAAGEVIIAGATDEDVVAALPVQAIISGQSAQNVCLIVTTIPLFRAFPVSFIGPLPSCSDRCSKLALSR